MKIKITHSVPVEPRIRPMIGEVYEAVTSKREGSRRTLYFIRVNGEQVGVFSNECQVVTESEGDDHA